MRVGERRMKRIRKAKKKTEKEKRDAERGI
jgi:hypothetical protein